MPFAQRKRIPGKHPSNSFPSSAGRARAVAEWRSQAKAVIKRSEPRFLDVSQGVVHSEGASKKLRIRLDADGDGEIKEGRERECRGLSEAKEESFC